MFSLPFSVKKEVIIEKPLDEVFSLVSDFSTWPQWSPWLCTEPEAKVVIAGEKGKEGHSQEWEGERIGSGKMILSEAVPFTHLNYHLNFLKPWKSKSKVGFEFEKVSAGTLVTWTMQGSVPLFLFFMRKMMSAWIGSDYERGLTMLKELALHGEIFSQIDVLGEVAREGFYYVGKRKNCSIKDVGPQMQQDFCELEKVHKEGNIPTDAFVFSFYHKFDMAKGECDYMAGFGFKDSVGKEKFSGLLMGQVKSHRALQVNHKGSYRFLGNAWATLMGIQRHLKKKSLKEIPMYEIYKTMPGSCEEKEMVTHIFSPFR